MVLAASALLGCTRGSVLDGQTQEPVSNADVNLFVWPPPSVSGSDSPFWEWPEIHSIPFQYTAHTTGSHNYWNDKPYNFAFNGYMSADSCSEHSAFPDDELMGQQWYRIHVEKPGYEPGFYYRYHYDYVELCNRLRCSDGQWVQSLCHTFEPFELYPENPEDPYLRLPDLIPDYRVLESDEEFDCAQTANSSVGSVTLRVPTALANVGMGRYRFGNEWINGVPFVEQKVLRSDGTKYRNPISEFFVHRPASNAPFKVLDWTALRLLQGSSSCNFPAEHRPSSCNIVDELRTAQCISETDPFDLEIEMNYGQWGLYDFCGGEQFLLPGSKARYEIDEAGQAIQLGSPQGPNNIVPSGSYLIEFEWDPTDIFKAITYQRDSSSHSARRTVTVPSFTTGSSPSTNPSCDTFTDCRNFWSMGWNDENLGRCADHLQCDTNSDCVALGLTYCHSGSGRGLPFKYCQ